MNTQKLFLFIAIFLTVFLLWDKWELTQSTDANGNVISQTQLIDNSSLSEKTDIPLASDVPVAEVSISDDSTPSVSDSNINSAYTTVVTDLLTVQISHKG